MDYHCERFTPNERAILSRHFTNLDSPVFALINLPEVVKSALFARYSRSSKSMRRLFLDEFVMSENSDNVPADSVGLADSNRAAKLFDRIFSEYGDDSVAQLGGAHIACEQASNLLTKILERGRLASYLEQSTRYIFFDKPLGESYRYGVPPEVAKSPFASLYRERMDYLFQTYAKLIPLLSQHYGKAFSRPTDVPESVWASSIRAKVCDDLRGLLPAATLSNVGIFASGQAFEALVIKMRSHSLGEVKRYGDLILAELQKVIPSFMKRVDLPSRGVRWTRYLEDIDLQMRQKVAEAVQESTPQRSEVQLTEWDPEAETKIVAAALYSYCQLPDDRLLAIARNMTDEERRGVIESYCGDRENRRHRPGRALERAFYRFDILAPYSVFRDLQRHRMLTIEWQALCTSHGFEVPDAVEEVGEIETWQAAMAGAADLYEQIKGALGAAIAQYAVPFGYRVRFCWHLNAREAFHVIELRTQRGGDQAYRRICQEMYRLIKEQAAHTVIAEAMRFVDDGCYELGRLESERRSAERSTVAASEQHEERHSSPDVLTSHR